MFAEQTFRVLDEDDNGCIDFKVEPYIITRLFKYIMKMTQCDAKCIQLHIFATCTCGVIVGS